MRDGRRQTADGGWCLGGTLLLLALLAGCGGPRQTDPAPTASGASFFNSFTGGTALRWVGPGAEAPVFDDPVGPRIDEVQRLLDDGLIDQARIAADRLAAEGVDHPGLWFLRARLAAESEDWLTAAGHCTNAERLSPGWPSPRWLHGVALIQAERPAAAAAVFADLERLLPDGPWGALGIAWAALRQGDQPAATLAADRALAKGPAHPDALRLRARLAAQDNQPALEERLLRRLAEPAPGDLVRLAALCAADRRWTDADRWLELAWDQATDPSIARQGIDLGRTSTDPAIEARWSRRFGGSPTAAPPGLTPASAR
jgi:hypothetical protein